MRSERCRSSNCTATTSALRALTRSSRWFTTTTVASRPRAAASEQGLLEAERAHDPRQQGQHRLVRMHAAQGGFTPLDQVADLLETISPGLDRQGASESRQKRPCGRARCAARWARRRAGTSCSPGGWASCIELGLEVWAAGFVAVWIWELTDDPAIAQARLRESYRVLDGRVSAGSSPPSLQSSRNVSTGRDATTKPSRCSRWRPRQATTTTS